MTIERIFTRPPGATSQTEHRFVRVLAGAGIEGDRYFDARDEPGQNVTFVEAEEIESFASQHGRPPDPSMTGRNVVTRGVRLNELVGREFFVGEVRFRGVELCEPCLTLGEALASATMSPAQVVKGWVHRAGLRADALSGGELSVGAKFDTASPVLRPITDDEYAAWLEGVIPEYAADKVASGQWSEDSALDLSRKEYEQLLPGGKSTENNHIHSVLDAEGRTVGTLWFAVKARAKKRVAYVYDIVIAAAHRRQGHAFRAFQALEQEVARLGLDGIALHVFAHNPAAHALYVKLGYVATNINMFKPVARAPD